MDKTQLKELVREVIKGIMQEREIGPTRMQIQKEYDRLKRAGLPNPKIMDELSKRFGIKNIRVRFDGTVVAYNWLEEASTTADAPGYQTPYAFSGNREEDDEKMKSTATQSGYELAESLEREMVSRRLVFENTYPTYTQLKQNEELSPRQKLGISIREIKKQLTEIEGFLDTNIRLKQESGVKSGDYWKRTHSHLAKLGENLNRVMGKIRELRS